MNKSWTGMFILSVENSLTNTSRLKRSEQNQKQTLTFCFSGRTPDKQVPNCRNFRAVRDWVEIKRARSGEAF